jgi:hypothetical protein
MVIIGKTGDKYLTIPEIEGLQKMIEELMKLKGLNIKTLYHPTYIEVPIVERKLKEVV